MKNFALALFLPLVLLVASCETTDLPPQTQSTLQELAEQLGPYHVQYDTNGDGILDAEERVAIPAEDLEVIDGLTAEFERIYQEGIQQNTTMFVNFLRGLGIPAPPGSEIPAGVLVALLFERPRRQATLAVKQTIEGLKNIGNAQGGMSFYEAGRSLVSIFGLVDSTKGSAAVANAEVAGKNVEVLVEEDDENKEPGILEG